MWDRVPGYEATTVWPNDRQLTAKLEMNKQAEVVARVENKHFRPASRGGELPTDQHGQIWQW
jgi:hypothetical protein